MRAPSGLPLALAAVIALAAAPPAALADPRPTADAPAAGTPAAGASAAGASAAGASATGSPAALKLSQKASLLGGRLEAALPADMKLEARGHSVMSADTSGQDETRAVLDLGPARFVMMTYELYALAGRDLSAAVAASKQAQGDPKPFQLAPLAVAKPLAAIADVPPPTKGDADANLVFAAWVASPDATVQLVAFYVNPDGAKATAAWTQLARAIALGLKPGARRLDTKPTTRSLGAGPEALTLATPDGWTLATQPGPDFRVYHLRKLAPLGGAAVSCGLYLGAHPSFQFQQAGVDKAKVKPTPATIAKIATTWQTWTADGVRFTTEAMAKLPTGGLVLHAFCSADTEVSLTDLRKLIETIQERAP